MSRISTTRGSYPHSHYVTPFHSYASSVARMPPLEVDSTRLYVPLSVSISISTRSLSISIYASPSSRLYCVYCVCSHSSAAFNVVWLLFAPWLPPLPPPLVLARPYSPALSPPLGLTPTFPRSPITHSPATTHLLPPRRTLRPHPHLYLLINTLNCSSRYYSDRELLSLPTWTNHPATCQALGVSIGLNLLEFDGKNLLELIVPNTDSDVVLALRRPQQTWMNSSRDEVVVDSMFTVGIVGSTSSPGVYSWDHRDKERNQNPSSRFLSRTYLDSTWTSRKYMSDSPVKLVSSKTAMFFSTQDLELIARQITLSGVSFCTTIAIMQDPHVAYPEC
ncbi:hypothetical protein Hypma_009904 [Hypsizygus marmoreus]|uniref:Uncharacterized protein n=1 Tax=Hypsizygus marmoreus TaxID=39966 RepID=A0A369JL85_HYPMA|nr:hypothetical protein Hypma_009904 [Hypsizygus marmoreus]